ncbi:hypothetical protein [Zwartia hollandica]|nr:hypothetical protein [Zwartia hollandica]
MASSSSRREAGVSVEGGGEGVAVIRVSTYKVQNSTTARPIAVKFSAK